MRLTGLHRPFASQPSVHYCNPSSCRPMRASAAVTPPPADYDFRADCRGSLDYVKAHYPLLVDLVEDGSLVAIQRPAMYVERRSDGYREPEVVLILGTAHLSKLSAQHARRLIETVRPDNVVVELCRSRAGIMYESQPNGESAKGEFQAGGGSFLEVTSRMLQLGGGSALVLRLLLARATKGLGKQMGLETGREFRAAREAADVMGAQLVLGDRPIEVSLQRAWEALGLKRRLQLIGGLVQATWMQPSADFDAAIVEQMQSDTAISAMLAEFAGRFPEVMPALIHERDVYLAWSLTRSKAVNGSQTVVGVLGKGHLPGVIHAMTHYHGELRFRDLAGSRQQKGGMQLKIVRRIGWEVALLVATVLLWNAWSEGKLA